MTTLNVQVPITNQPNSTEDPKIATTFTNLGTWANGNIDSGNIANGGIAAANFSAALAQAATVNQASQTVKGAVNISTSQGTSSTTYTTLATPDQVTGIVLPANGLIAVWYQATVQESVNGAARIAIFIGSNQLKFASNSGTAPQVQEAAISQGSPNLNCPIASYQGGLVCNAGLANWTGDVTTGQVVGYANTAGAGGPAWVFAAAGTYTVSVQFKASSGSVTAAGRKLWVQALSFA